MAGVRSYRSKIADTVISAATGYVIDIQDMAGFDIEVDATVNSTAKTAIDAVKATLTTQTNLVLTAVVNAAGSNGTAGNSITVAFTAGGTAGSEVVTVVGSAISVQVQSGVSTVTQVRTAMQAAAACTALVTTTGTNASTIVTAAAVPLSGGLDSKFDVVNSAVSITAHGYFTGQVVRATTSAGSLPTGLSTSTDYFVFVVDANTLQLFDTLAHALAATRNGATAYSTSTGLIAITADGTAGSTVTLTPTAVSSCSYKLQKSNSWVPSLATGNFIDLVAGETNSVVTNTISATANSAASARQVYASYAKVLFAISAGTVAIQVYASAKSV